jgi:hypothetical protein
MRFVLKYFIDNVSVELAVDATTPEQGETMLKRCVSKLLKNFPVGLLFAELGPAMGQAVLGGQWYPANDGSMLTPNPLPVEWNGNNSAPLMGHIVPNDSSYVITVGGSLLLNNDGSYTIHDSSASAGLQTNNSGGLIPPSASGSFVSIGHS